MTRRIIQDEGPFAIVFESLRAAEALAVGTDQIRLMKTVAGDVEWDAIDELRRLSESMAEPELRTYTAG